MSPPHVRVLLTTPTVPDELTGALRELNATASFSLLTEQSFASSASADALVVVPPEDRNAPSLPIGGAARRCRSPMIHAPATSRSCFTDRVPGAAGGAARSPAARPAGQSGAARTAREADVATVFQRFERQLRMASRIQRRLAPQTLPRLHGLTLSVVHRPVDLVSGDLYEVRRLDEHHVGVFVADAVGHGLPAALLSLFAKRAIQGCTTARQDCGLKPDLVMQRLNAEVGAAGHFDCDFLSAVYAVLDTRTRSGVFARAGAPYPLLRRRNGRVETLRASGMLLGIDPAAEFEAIPFHLSAGDDLVIYTDGLECVARVAPGCVRTPSAAMASSTPAALRREFGGLPSAGMTLRHVLESAWRFALCDATDGVEGVGNEAEAGSSRGDAHPDEWITRSPWCQALRRQGCRAAFELADSRHGVLRRLGGEMDDLTMLAISADV